MVPSSSTPQEHSLRAASLMTNTTQSPLEVRPRTGARDTIFLEVAIGRPVVLGTGHAEVPLRLRVPCRVGRRGAGGPNSSSRARLRRKIARRSHSGQRPCELRMHGVTNSSKYGVDAVPSWPPPARGESEQAYAILDDQIRLRLQVLSATRSGPLRVALRAGLVLLTRFVVAVGAGAIPV